MKDKIIFLVGPTAVGKSAIAACLARKINAEIISCDSMQVYKGMDIITSKPSLAIRKKVKHHLMDVVSPTKEYNVVRYRQEALKKIKAIIKRGRVPLFVGGTGLYMSILLDGIFKPDTQNKNIRRRLLKEAEVLGKEKLYERLKDIDPQAASKIHPNDSRRVIRALEVFESTGKPISLLQKQRKGLEGEYELKIFCLNLERRKLYARIEERTEKMFAQGLVPEVKRILKSRLSKTAFSAIGIKEIKGYLEGEYDLEQAKQLIKRNSRLYAKRQLTWFKKDKRIVWIELGDKEKPREIAGRILELLRQPLLVGTVPAGDCPTAR